MAREPPASFGVSPRRRVASGQRMASPVAKPRAPRPALLRSWEAEGRAARPGWPLYSAASSPGPTRALASPHREPRMYYFAYGFKKPIAPLLALQVAQQAMVSAGFTVFDPVAPGKITLGGTQTQAGVLVTVVAMDCEGGAAVVVNGFCANDLAVDSARSFAENIAGAVNYA